MAELLFLSGTVAVLGGIAWWSPAAACVVGGLIAMSAGISLADRRRP